MEALCDEERYLELHTDLAEKTMYEGTFHRAKIKVFYNSLYLSSSPSATQVRHILFLFIQGQGTKNPLLCL